MAFSLNQPFTLLSTLLLLLLLNSSLCESFHGFSRYGARISGDGSSRHLLESRNTQQPNNCGELVAQSQCSRNSKCSWCTSEDLDDMCFSKSEAWRLPQQGCLETYCDGVADSKFTERKIDRLIN
ncbi:hypothetical protein PHAVU_006G171300 [Phaseolus vulgaris]